MKYATSIVAAGIAAFAAMPAHAADQATLAQVFGQRQSILDASISPSGTKIAIVAPGSDTGEVLFIVDLAGNAAVQSILNNDQDNQHLQWCDWISEERMLCQIRAQVRGEQALLGVSRLVAVSTDGSVKLVSDGTNNRSLGGTQAGGSIVAWHVDDAPGAVLITRDYVPERTTGTHSASRDDGLGVDRLDVESLHRRPVERAHRETVRYLADQHGEIRARINREIDSDGYISDETDIYYRMLGDSDWHRLDPGSSLPEDFWPVSIDSKRNVAIGFGERDGRQALMSVSLDGSNKIGILLADERVDIDSLMRIGAARRVIGASFATDRRHVEYFDPKMAELADSLHQALPGQPQIGLLDESDDGKRILLSASSDTDPGMLYLYHAGEKRLEEILPVRDGTVGMTMAAMKPVTYRAADGNEIPAYLTLPPGSSGKGLKALVMPHGGPSSRDEWGFDWLVQFFAQAGYAVLQPNFRGSSGYGDEWYAENGFKSWKIAIGDVNDAGRWLVNQGIAAPESLGIFGWSYGGYAALQSQVLDPDLFKAIVAVAPVTDLAMLREEAQGFTNARLVSEFIGNGPHVREGSPLQQVDAIESPVLIFHGSKDENVGVNESRAMVEALREAGKQVTYVEFDGLEHNLASNTARAKMLAEARAFLDKELAR